MSTISLRLVRVLCCALAIEALAARNVAAQVPGDVDCDTVVADPDLDALIPELFSDDTAGCAGVDVNTDTLVGAADITALILELRRVYAGPQLTFLGLTSSDGRRTTPLGTLPDGSIVYYRNSGFGFQIVVEAMSGSSGSPVATGVFNYNRDDPARRPDFFIQPNRDLGEPSPEVCDEDFGVPGFNPPSFAVTQPISDGLNDLSCRFHVTTVSNTACTQDAFGQTAFMMPDSRAQFCLPVGRPVLFPADDTMLTVQLHDEQGNPGRPARLVVRVGSGPMPPTFTAVPPTSTRTPTFTRTPTLDATSTPTPTSTPVATRTFTRTATRTATRVGPSPTRTQTPSRTPTLRPGVPTPTFSRTPTRTATVRLNTPTPTRMTSTPTRTRTATRPGPTHTPTRSFTPTRSLTPTRTTPQTPTATATFGVARGPVIRFMGMTKADDTLIAPEPLQDPNDPNELPVYVRPFGSGFSLVVEARPGVSGRPVAKSTFNDGGCPDLQIQVTRALGENPTEAVCDILPPDPGGVPGISPPSLDDSFTTCARLNDLGCRFADGLGAFVGRNCNNEQSCVRFENGDFGCVAPDATAQFCGFIAKTIEFPLGETLVTVRARDTQGNLGPIAQMIVRVE